MNYIFCRAYNKGEFLKNIFIISTGCPECIMDANMLDLYLSNNRGYNIINNFKEADYIIVLGCAVTENREKYTYEVINYLSNYKKIDCKLIVLGCISKINRDLSLYYRHGSLDMDELNNLLMIGNSTLNLTVHSCFRFDDNILKNAILKSKSDYFIKRHNLDNKSVIEKIKLSFYDIGFHILDNYKNYLDQKILSYNRKTICLKISMGCRNNCSYCSIKIARGTVKSEPLELIKSEVKTTISKGHREFSLIGTNIGDYGKDINHDLYELLDYMVSIKEDIKIRLRNLHPRWLIDNFNRFSQYLKSDKIVFIQSPVQSMSDRILKLMNRNYNSDEYIDCINQVRLLSPQIILKTHLMVGFPSETENDFEQSLILVDKNIFDYISIFRFTCRPITKAYYFEPKVPDNIIMDRFKKIIFKALFNHPLRKIRAIYRLS